MKTKWKVELEVIAESEDCCPDTYNNPNMHKQWIRDGLDGYNYETMIISFDAFVKNMEQLKDD